MFDELKFGSKPATAALQRLLKDESGGCTSSQEDDDVMVFAAPSMVVSRSNSFSSSCCSQEGEDEDFPSIEWPEESMGEFSCVTPPKRAIAIKHLKGPKSMELMSCDLLIRTRRVRTQLSSLDQHADDDDSSSKPQALASTKEQTGAASSSIIEKPKGVWQPDFEKYLGITPDGIGDNCGVYIVA
jgi:hypothetical protein